MTVLRVVDLTAEGCYDLRRRVLRAGTPSGGVAFAEDDTPGVFHLGVDADGTLVGVATCFPSATPWRAGRPAAQVRGMAVDRAWQGRGIGRALLDEALARVRAEGIEVLWANARDSALGFYERFGMQVVGDGFRTEDTLLPHHVVILDLEPDR